jgi:hypothetical protein
MRELLLGAGAFADTLPALSLSVELELLRVLAIVLLALALELAEARLCTAAELDETTKDVLSLSTDT